MKKLILSLFFTFVSVHADANVSVNISVQEYNKLMDDISNTKIPKHPITCDGKPSKISPKDWHDLKNRLRWFADILKGEAMERAVESNNQPKKSTSERFADFVFKNKKCEYTLCVGKEYKKMLSEPAEFREATQLYYERMDARRR